MEVYRVGPCYVFLGNPNIPNGAGMEFLGFTRGDVTVAPNLNISTGRVDQIGMSGLAEAAWSGGLNPSVTAPLVDEDKAKLEEYILGSKRVAGSMVTAPVATAGNTGVLTFNTVSGGDDVESGDYLLRAEVAGNAAAARFELLDPDGNLVMDDIRATVAVDTDHLDFTITAVTTPVVVDDEWTITVAGGASLGFGSGFSALDVIGTMALIPYDELSSGTNGVDAPNGVWLPAAVCYDVGNWVYNTPEGTDDALVVHECMFRGLRVKLDSRPLAAGDAARQGTDRILLPREHRVMLVGPPGSIAAQSIGADDYTAPDWSLPATGEV